MKITKNIISDLWPLYAANECSADTWKLVDGYLHEKPCRGPPLSTHKIRRSSVPESSSGFSGGIFDLDNLGCSFIT